MGAYVVRRLGLMVVMLVLLSIFTFLMFAALPTDPARLTCGKSCSPAIIEANRIRLGLDKPLTEQYWLFVKGIFVGRTYGSGTATFDCSAPCLGYSFRKGAEVTDLIMHALPITVSVAVGAFVLWILAGVSIGIFAALRRGTWQDKAAMGAALVGYSMPSFFIGLLLYFFVIVKWSVLPPPDYEPLLHDPQAWFQTLILPWVTLALLYAAFYARLTRGQMLETLGDDYIRTARAKGVSERRVIYRHGLRAGLTPIVTAAGLDLAGLLGGAIITEQVFNLPGVGRLAISSVVDADLPIIVGITLITAFFVILGNLVVDLLYAAIDPRVRLA